MSWKQDVQLYDLEPLQMLEITCRKCRYSWLESVEEALQKVEHSGMYIDEVENTFACVRPLCRHVGVKIMVIHDIDTEAFVGGLP